MDGNQFDNLIRAFAAGRSRRSLATVVAGVGAGSLFASLLGVAENAGAKKGKGKGKGKKKKKKKPATCVDKKKNGAETDVDCGGGKCPRCAVGQRCNTRNDCISARCVGGVCQTCSNNPALECGTDINGVSTCGCRDHVSGQRFCTKPDGNPGVSCADCKGDEQCFPIPAPGTGVNCVRPCGV